LAVFLAITGKMEAGYKEWGTQIQDNWSPDDPMTQ
jgi:hypothetical protein